MSETAKGDVSVVEADRTQRAVARRAAEAKATVPELTLTTEIDLDALLAAGLDPDAAVVRASALALREVPRANASYRDGGFELFSRVNVGVTVPTAESQVVPTIFDADRKGVEEIAAELAELSAAAAEGTLSAPRLAGATFTVSSLAEFGITAFTAVIQTPQAAALAVGTPTPRSVVRGGESVVRTMAIATLSCDHRILYGGQAARFLARVRELLEDPASLG